MKVKENLVILSSLGVLSTNKYKNLMLKRYKFDLVILNITMLPYNSEISILY